MRAFLSLVVCLVAFLADAGEKDDAIAFPAGSRILFQGDSITDGNRGRSEDPNHILGHGYCFIVAARFGGHHPERNLVFLNRGISGNTVTALAARWTNDTIALKPDVISILVGVNDASQRIPVEQFATNYDKLLHDTFKALPKVRIVLCEPFTLPVGKHKDNYAAWRADIQKRQDVVAKLAAKYKLPVVHFQKVFDEAARNTPDDRWIWDGVHPTYAGHQLMADEWIRTVRQFWPDRS